MGSGRPEATRSRVITGAPMATSGAAATLELARARISAIRATGDRPLLYGGGIPESYRPGHGRPGRLGRKDVLVNGRHHGVCERSRDNGPLRRARPRARRGSAAVSRLDAVVEAEGRPAVRGHGHTIPPRALLTLWRRGRSGRSRPATVGQEVSRRNPGSGAAPPLLRPFHPTAARSR